jgi:poly(A) polymerase
MTEREFATEVVSKLQREGHQALFAGGCVRDELLGLTPADFDVATSARPEEVQAHFRRTHTFGASFGVVEVLGPKDEYGEWLKVQVATFRSDGTYTDGRRPDSVVFSSPEEDAARRDFTINGLFRDPISGKLWDFVGGEADLKAGVLRAIGNAEERFTEDKLRILRAVRMAARFELEIEPYTLAAMKRMADQIRVVSAERIAEELRKILKHSNREQGVWLLQTLGLHTIIIPESAGVESQRYRFLPRDASFELAFTLMLFLMNHRSVTALCQRLRLSNNERERIEWLYANRHALTAATQLPNSSLFPLLAHPGIGELLTLYTALCDHRSATFGHRLDLYSLHRNPNEANTESADVGYVQRLLRDHPPETFNPPPLITGDDLKDMGLKPGPVFKKLLDEVRALQLDGQLKDRREAEEIIRERVRSSQ